MVQKRLGILSILLALVIALSTFGTHVSHAQDKVNLTWLTHWGEEVHLKEQQALIDEYQKANPNVTITLQTVLFDDLLTKIITGHTAGTSPDIYHFYNLWMPEFVSSGLLSTPPDDVIDMVKKNTPPGVQQGVTAGGKIWGLSGRGGLSIIDFAVPFPILGSLQRRRLSPPPMLRDNT